MILLTILWYLFLISLVLVFFYVAGTYLLFAYDRRLSRTGLLLPTPQERDDYPSRKRRRAAFAKEVLSTLAIVWLWPFGELFKHPWKLSSNKGRPVILVHGFKLNQSAWFLLRRRLKAAGLGPIYSLNLKSVRGPIEAFAQQVHQLADQVERETGISQVILIGHSMGGIVSAYYAQELSPPRKVSHLIMLGSPVHGTRSAVMACAACTQELRPGSELLSSLRMRMTTSPTRFHFIASQFDNIIFPYQAALLGPEIPFQRLLSNHGHMTLLFSKTVAKQIVDWLRVSSASSKTKSSRNSKAILIPSGKSPAYRSH